LAKKINSAVFPGQQGGPLEHVIAAKAVSFKVAASAEFAERQRRTLSGARILASRLLEADVAEHGITVATRGTDVHLVLVDLREAELDGQQAEDRLHGIGITVNRNAVPMTRARRWSAPGCASAPRRWPPGASALRTRRGGRRHRPGAAAGLRRGRAACPGVRPGGSPPALPGRRGLRR